MEVATSNFERPIQRETKKPCGTSSWYGRGRFNGDIRPGLTVVFEHFRKRQVETAIEIKAVDQANPAGVQSTWYTITGVSPCPTEPFPCETAA